MGRAAWLLLLQGIAAVVGQHFIAPDLRMKRLAGSNDGSSGKSGVPGPATSALLETPVGVSLSREAYVTIADSYNNRIVVVDHTGTLRNVAGDVNGAFSDVSFGDPLYDGSQATSARMYGPNFAAYTGAPGASTLIISDTNNNRIRSVATNGVITSVWTGLNWPKGVAADVATGTYFFADTDNNRVHKVVSGTKTLLAGTGARSFSGEPWSGVQRGRGTSKAPCTITHCAG